MLVFLSISKIQKKKFLGRILFKITINHYYGYFKKTQEPYILYSIWYTHEKHGSFFEIGKLPHPIRGVGFGKPCSHVLAPHFTKTLLQRPNWGVPMIDIQHFCVKYLFILQNKVPEFLIELSWTRCIFVNSNPMLGDGGLILN